MLDYWVEFTCSPQVSNCIVLILSKSILFLPWIL